MSNSGHGAVLLRRGPIVAGHDVLDHTSDAFVNPVKSRGIDALQGVDLDGDGQLELGASTSDNVFILTDADFGGSTTAAQGFEAPANNIGFGASLAAWPDPVAGVDRLMCGATQPFPGKAGAVFRLDGFPTGWSTIDTTTTPHWKPSTTQESAGASLAQVGDRDGDLVADVLVGGGQRAWLVSGASLAIGGSSAVLATFDPRETISWGFVEAAGDEDGDGQEDLIIGFQGLDHPHCDSGDPDTPIDTACEGLWAGRSYGMVWRITGNPRGTVMLERADAIADYTRDVPFMAPSADAGDLDGDGDVEVLLPVSLWRGDALLLLDDDAPPERLFEGTVYASAVADVTADGRPDLVILGPRPDADPAGTVAVFELCPAP